jgi:hypothetical protein
MSTGHAARPGLVYAWRYGVGMAGSVTGQLRAAAEVRAAYEALGALPNHVREYPTVRGLVAGYAWVLGLSDVSPARDVPGRPAGWDDVRYEGRVAEAAAGRWASISNSLARRPAPDPPPTLERGYAEGVRDALKWAAGLIVGPAPTLRETEQLRAPAEITAARTAAVRELAEAAPGMARDFMAGAIDAYDWLLGRRGSAPVSEQVAEPLPRRVEREEEIADDAIYRRPGAPEVRRHWAVGVQHALMWSRHAADHPPR